MAAPRIVGYDNDGNPIYETAAIDPNTGSAYGQQSSPPGVAPPNQERMARKAPNNDFYIGPDGNYYVDPQMTKRVEPKAPYDPLTANPNPMPTRPTPGAPTSAPTSNLSGGKYQVDSNETSYRETGQPAADRARQEGSGVPGVGDGSAFNDYMKSLGLKLPTAGFDFAAYLGPAEQVFRQELDRLSQADPFGNQAFLQKATDRAIGQAAGFAAGARGGAGAVGGAFRQAQGVQSQLAAQGAQEMAEQKAQDAQQAQAARLSAASGLGQLAATGVQAGTTQDQQNIDAFSASFAAAANFEGLTQAERQGFQQLELAYRQLDSQERQVMAQIAAEYDRIDANLYATDMDYRAKTDANIMNKYQIDSEFKLGMERIKAEGKLTGKDIFKGTLGAVAAVGGGLATLSDRRAKKDIANLDMDDVRDYLAKSRGYSYKYKDEKHGKGQNFGPMAQGLNASKLGKAAIVDKGGFLHVDTARLALTDHAVLVELHKELESIKGKLK